MQQADLLELFDAYLDQRLSETDRAALSATLASSPQACRLFWEYAHQHALLSELLAEAHGRELAAEETRSCLSFAVPEEPIPEQPTIPFPARTQSRRFRRVARWTMVAAATLLCAIGLAWLVRPVDDHASTSDPALARLGELKGDVRVLIENAFQPARIGQVLRPGEEIRTGEDSFAVVTYPDNSRFELNSGTAVRLLDEPGDDMPGKRVFLVHGYLNANIKPQPADRPLRFSTDEADLIVRGNRFSAAGIAGETRIEMEEGRALLARKGDRKTIEVSAGTYAVAAPDMELYTPSMLVPASQRPFAVLEEGSGPILAVAPVLNGQLAVGCGNGLVRLWDVRTRRVRATLDAGMTRVHALAASPDGKSLAVGYFDNRQKKEPTALIWDLPRRETRLALPCPNRVTALSFLPDGRSLALISGPRGVLLWDLPDLRRRHAPVDRRERLQLGDRLDRPLCLKVSPDGRLVAVGYRDGSIRLWDTTTGRVDREFSGHSREVQSLAFQPGGKVLASGSRDGTVRLWSLETGDELKSLTGPFNEVRCLTFSPDGQTLATGHAGIAVLWSVQTGERRSILKAHKFAITALLYLDEGRTLATAGWDRTVKLWKLEPAAGSTF